MSNFLWFISGEFILDYRANGSSTIVFRSMWVTVWLYAIAATVRGLLETGVGSAIDWSKVAEVVRETIPWAGAIFAGVYAALYSRFSSQWTYLAETYNQLMSTQIQTPIEGSLERKESYELWKAAIVEDAADLHLAAKPMFAVMVLNFLSDPGVYECFRIYAAQGEERLPKLIEKCEKSAKKRLSAMIAAPHPLAPPPAQLAG